MQVTFPSHHRWQCALTEDPTEHFSPRTAGKIRTALALLEKVGVSYEIAPLSEEFLTQFMPLYTEHIGGKANALIHDVHEKTLGKEASSFPYYSLSLFEQGVFIGGTIFSLRPDRISFAYRTFNQSWNQANLKISPAYIGEYALSEFGSAHKLPIISHGKDRNPYGLNAAIGLATFKLSVGCHPYVPENVEVKTLDTETLTQDALILTYPTEGSLINHAYLVTLPENEHKYIQVTKYPDQLTVEVLYRA